MKASSFTEPTYKPFPNGQISSGLIQELNAQGIVSKQRLSRRGLTSGGVPYSRGALYELLKNRLYLGEIPYRGEVYRGQHEAIVERSLWERVQQHLARGRTACRA